MINELSNKISQWLQGVLTPDKMKSVQDYITSRFNEVLQHKIDLYLDYLGISKDNILHHLNSSMPDVWSDTTGKVIEQIIKSLGG